MVFGLFKKKKVITADDKVSALCMVEERISLIYGYPTLTEGRRTRIKFSIACAAIGVSHTISSSQSHAFAEHAIDIIFKSAERQGRLKVSDIFYFKETYKGAVLNFTELEFVSRSKVFSTANTWTNGRGALSEILDVYGRDAVNWIVERRDNIFHACSLLTRTLATGSSTGDSIADLRVAEEIRSFLINYLAKNEQ